MSNLGKKFGKCDTIRFKLRRNIQFHQKVDSSEIVHTFSKKISMSLTHALAPFLMSGPVTFLCLGWPPKLSLVIAPHWVKSTDIFWMLCLFWFLICPRFNSAMRMKIDRDIPWTLSKIKWKNKNIFQNLLSCNDFWEWCAASIIILLMNVFPGCIWYRRQGFFSLLLYNLNIGVKIK